MKAIKLGQGMENCKDCAVHPCSPFANVNNEFLNRLGPFSESVTFKAGDLIYKGDESNPQGLLCVRRGLAYDSTTLPNGDRHVPRIYTPGTIAPVWALTTVGADAIPAGDVFALGEVTGCFVPAEALSRLSRDNADALQSYLNFVSMQLRSNDDQVRFLRSTSAEERVRSFFGLMLKEYGMILKIERSLLATIADLTISSVSRIITHFEQRGWIRRHGWEIEILDTKQFAI